MLAQAQTLLSTASEGMQGYCEERSEAWQESSQAEELLAKSELLQEAVSQLQTSD